MASISSQSPFSSPFPSSRGSAPEIATGSPDRQKRSRVAPSCDPFEDKDCPSRRFRLVFPPLPEINTAEGTNDSDGFACPASSSGILETGVVRGFPSPDSLPRGLRGRTASCASASDEMSSTRDKISNGFSFDSPPIRAIQATHADEEDPFSPMSPLFLSSPPRHRTYRAAEDSASSRDVPKTPESHSRRHRKTRSFHSPDAKARSPSSALPTTPESLLSPTAGPSPSSSIAAREIPNTVQRQELRLQGFIARSSPGSKAFIPIIFAQLKINPPLTTLLDAKVLESRISEFDPKYQKKCFTICQVVLFELSEEVKLHVLSEEMIDKTFVSADHRIHAEDDRLIGVDPEIMYSVARSDAPIPVIDYHSERACLMWLEENIHRFVPKTIGGTSLGKRHIVHINMISKYSSCRHCIRVFGSIENASRITNCIQRILMDKLSLTEVNDIPHVTIAHRGLSHHHPMTRNGCDEPSTELYSSTSLISRSYWSYA
ncbi:MAG: hypothetical protein K9M07_00385 [Simkaniaceae bacterium]|nr:hypothetical protein [Simkaniaceae bacterium]